MILDSLRHPIVQAPMAGGPSTSELALAVSAAGGLGFLAGAYRSADAMGAEIRQLRQRTDRPFGVNVFVPGSGEVDQPALDAYLARVEPDANRYGVALGRARYDDDGWDDKVAVLLRERPPVASFTFGCPPPDLIDALRGHGVGVWVTVTAPDEAEIAQRAGADALVVQGIEAGGHQGSFRDDDPERYGLLALLQLIRAGVRLPLVASGGIATGRAVAAVLAAGADAAQIGTAFMLTPEAATHPAHRAALASDAPTELTRAFSGRQARGIRNRFQAAHSAGAPSAYPHVHLATSPLRAAARAADQAGDFNLWAGQTRRLARVADAAEIVERLSSEARQAAAETLRRLAPPGA